MPLTKIDPNPALVIIDFQRYVLGVPTVHPIDEVIDRSARLARAFRERRMPVFLVRVAGVAGRGRTDAPSPNFASLPAGWSEFVPQLEQHADDLVVSKPGWDAFIGTSLDNDLRTRGITQIFLSGVATSIGVESTARSACDYGYNVAPLLDAMTDRDAEAHRHTVEKIFPRLGEAALTDDIFKLLS